MKDRHQNKQKKNEFKETAIIQVTEEITEKLILISLDGNEEVLHPQKNINLYKEKI